ncbi:hypothetical protein [Salipiger sp. 1_MG-2023]|uniref:hypothetical protein n=1 Tax=Salipiger sp. 1_MG-2023 TaxID=3062665 RepID=UPI0026E43BF5|nr:hypothetical protein [Salipiger sp. 1_MG-2023]
MLQRSKATIYREIKRDWFSDECLPGDDGDHYAAAHQKAIHRRARQRKLIRHPELRNQVVERIKNGPPGSMPCMRLSADEAPEQIDNRLIHDGAQLRVCHALPGRRCPERRAIFREIYSKEGMAQELCWYLPEHRKARRPRRARKRCAPKVRS